MGRLLSLVVAKPFHLAINGDLCSPLAFPFIEAVALGFALIERIEGLIGRPQVDPAIICFVLVDVVNQRGCSALDPSVDSSVNRKALIVQRRKNVALRVFVSGAILAIGVCLLSHKLTSQRLVIKSLP